METSKPVRPPRVLPPLLLALSLSGAYFATLAPGLTWANDGADGGDLITAAATAGVAHPPGYPLYLLIARLFLALPLGAPAWRTNLMSAVFAVLAALLVYAIVLRETNNWVASLAAGGAAGLAPLLWSQAVITEVHGLQACLVALVIFLSTGPKRERWKKPLDSLRGLTLGLASGNHMTILLLLPVVVMVNAFRSEQTGGTRRLDWGALARQLLFFLVGCLIYLLLPVWAQTRPPVNWGYALTLERLFWQVTGGLYQDQLLSVPAGQALQRLSAWAGLLVQQYGLVGLLLGAISLFFFHRGSRLFMVTAWTLLAYTMFAVGFDSFDSYVYLIPAFLAFAIWIGVGAGGLLDAIAHDSPGLTLVAGAGMIIFFAWLGIVHRPQVDASQDRRAESFAGQVLAQAPERALVFAEGDRAVFSLWYFHFVLRQRPDLVVVATDLLDFDWYQETLKDTYPQIAVPSLPLPEEVSAANPSLPICLVSYREEASIECGELSVP